MNKTVPWSIKGVGPDTREAAKEAARRSGLSLGEWLDGIIAERASRLGVPSVEIDNQERLDAVADELSRLAARSTASEGGQELGAAAPPETSRDAPWAAVPQARFAGLPAEGLRSRDTSAPEARTFDSATTSVEQSFFGSRESVPNALQASQGRGSVDNRVRAAVNGSLAERLDFEEELPPTQRALRALSEKLESFERQNWAGVVRHAAEGPDRTMGEAGPLLIRKPGSAISAIKERSIRYAVAEIARRQAALYEEDPVPTLSTATDASSLGASAENGANKRSDPRRSGANLGALDQAVASIEAKLTSERLAANVERATPSPNGRAADLPPAEVVAPDGGEDSMAAFAALGRDLRQAIGSEEAPIAPMSQAPVSESADGVADVLDASAKGVRVPGARKRRELRDRPASDSDGAYVADKTGEQQSFAMTPFLGNPGSGDLLEAQTTLSEIRALLNRFEPGSAISSLERRMEDLAAKIDRGMEPQSSSKQIEDLARQIDEMHSSIQGQMGSQVVEPSSVDALVRGIADRIEEAREASADIERLESLIKGLATKIDDSNAHPDPQAVNGLEAQMSRLGERLERSEASLSALDGVEHSLGELFTQLEETRHAAIDAAENAARTAARDTLRAAMQNPAMPQGAAEGESGLFGQVAHELAELRVSHDQTSRRTQSTLAGLNQTMERLVEHLARLDVAGLSGDATDRPPSAAEGAGDRRKSVMAPAVRAELGLPERRKSSDTDRPADTVDPIDTLIEPGLGRASIRDRSGKSDGAVAGDAEGPAFFIAAARRAAQAAQASAAATHKPSGRVRVSGESTAATELSALERARNFLRERRRPLLLSLAGLVLLLGALEVAKLGVSGTVVPEHTGAAEPVSAPAVEQAALQTPLTDATTPASNPTASAPVVSPKDEPALASPPAPATASALSADTTAVAAPTAVPTGTVAASAAAAVKAPVAARNMNPFLPGNDFKLGGLSESLRSVALAGDPAAQYEVGLRFAEGRTVNRDVKAAANWFEKAAVQGLAPAQYRLGSAYEKGVGQPKNPALALTWYGRAADAGNMRAMHNLAVMAAEGAVGKPDYAKAAGWFAKAAALGVRDSQFNLAILYARGLGIELSLAKSYTWFAIAASQGDEDAGKKRDEVGARLDAKTLADAKAAAEAFRPSTAVSAANEVSPPPGGWDAAAPSRSIPSAAKTMPPRFSVM